MISIRKTDTFIFRNKDKQCSSIKYEVYNTALEQTRDNVRLAQKQTPISYNQYQVIAKIETEILATTTTTSNKDN